METCQRTIMDLTRNTSKWDRRVNAAAGRLRTSDKVSRSGHCAPRAVDSTRSRARRRRRGRSVAARRVCEPSVRGDLLVRRINGSETAYYRLWVRSDADGVQSDLITTPR
jgi:hypothetical protein